MVATSTYREVGEMVIPFDPNPTPGLLLLIAASLSELPCNIQPNDLEEKLGITVAMTLAEVRENIQKLCNQDYSELQKEHLTQILTWLPTEERGDNDETDDDLETVLDRQGNENEEDLERIHTNITERIAALTTSISGITNKTVVQFIRWKRGQLNGAKEIVEKEIISNMPSPPSLSRGE